MRQIRWLFPLALALLAAGCVASADPDPVRAAAAGDGSFALRVLVTDEPSGPPVPGAKVTVTLPAQRTWDGDRGEQVLDVHTGPDGVATAHVEGPGEATVVVTAPGFTVETQHDVEVAGSGEREIVVPLYRATAQVEIRDVLAPGDASLHRAGFGEFHWQPHAVSFGHNEEARRGYAARLVSLNVTLEWTNTATALGDLGIAIGRSENEADVVEDASGYQLPPGSYVETSRLGLHDMRRSWASASTLYVGAGTGTAYVAPTGIPYVIKVDAVFDGAQRRNESPGPGGLLGALGALGIGALLVGRRR